MREFPDVLGMDLADAEAWLKDRGETVQILVTKPDRGAPEDGYDKVIKQEISENGWILTVCKVPDAYR